MSSSSSTTPTDRTPTETRATPHGAPSRRRRVVTWALVSLWVFIICFGTVNTVRPLWLEGASGKGRSSELLYVKNFGDDALRRGDYRRAIGEYEQALKLDPDHIGVQVNLGIAWIEAGFSEKGAMILGDVLKKTESEISKGLAHFALGGVCEKRGSRDEAIRHYRTAAEYGTNQARRFTKLGTLYLAGGELAEAREAFQQALDSQLDVRTSYMDMMQRTADELTDDPEELALVRQALANPPSLEEMERYNLAIIRELQKQSRNLAVTHNYLGWVYVQMEEFESAAQHFEESLQIWPGNRNAAENLRIIRQIEKEYVGGAVGG